jgi:hypothetical protein
VRCYSQEQLSFQSACETKQSDEQLKLDDGELPDRYGRLMAACGAWRACAPPGMFFFRLA